ncbi:LysR family transcriptional regulator [Zwartia panacis]|uniref:LysR family transcriptional regulator n=1 Tax=Zwartia panacis TaxID=2683345 RepID=UPI0025B317FE|nr:LysR family transcriptional regulator [Zwartia panacis]MDN4018089.1 LysR family transcriptional regulator [Zwartia panacis]
MDKLKAIEVFIEVAQGLSFSGAAQRLGMAKGNVTKHVAWLEQTLGVQLLTRTTKSVSLTESGLSLLENGRELLDRVESIDAAVRQSVKEPKGMLRLGAPPSFGAFHLVPIITAFSSAHPDIQVVLYLDDGRTDLVAEGLDMSVRIATSLKDTSQVAQRLAVVPQLLVASPAYLKRRGTPQTIADLADHECMVHALKSPTNIWTFMGEPKGVRVHGTIRANYGDPLRHAALLGHGISMHPTYMVMQDIQEGRLVSVLPQFRPVGVDIYAVFPSRKNLPVRVRTFLDFLRQWFAAEDWHAYQNVP